MALAGLVITSILTGNGEYPSDKSFLREVKVRLPDSHRAFLHSLIVCLVVM
jgi:hypothetical protein